MKSNIFDQVRMLTSEVRSLKWELGQEQAKNEQLKTQIKILEEKLKKEGK